MAGLSSIADAVAWRQAQRAAGHTVAFTNGCFDLLHAGHVALLEAARATADALVVAINDDASLQRLKGPERPIVPLEERAELLAALAAVDCVVAYTDDTPLRSILALEPDFLVKGADWAEDQIVGAPEVKAWGGRVVRVPLREGLSTTNLVKRILEVYRPTLG